MTYYNRLLFVLTLFSFSCSEAEEDYPDVVFENAAVVSAHPIASEIGKEILQNGGNAFDATVGVQFALSVVYPIAGNISGGGFSVFQLADGESGTIDYRETAPRKAHRDMYLDSLGEPIENLSVLGALSVGVPGTVRGMWDLHQKYGSMDWKELILPSVEIANNGWVLTENEIAYLDKYGDKIRSQGTSIFTDQNFKAGDSIKNPNMAAMLSRIADFGPDDFYSGETAKILIETLSKNGGIIDSIDLANYTSIWREPIIGSYDSFEVISMPPPSSGGIALLSLLKMSERFNLSDWGKWDSKSIHATVELEKLVYADRSVHLGDPDYYDVPVEELLNQEYMMLRSEMVSMDSSTPSSYIKSGEFVRESPQTTHYSIIDEYGNAVSTTTTLNGAYGSKLFIPELGFFMNNEMDDFSVKPGIPNQYGLIGAEANAIEPGKRMLSSMTPTIVSHENKPVLILGSPGGSTIITSVFQNILNVLKFGYSIEESVHLPRYHHQYLPDSLFYEANFTEFIDSTELSVLGHELRKREPIGKVDAIFIDSKGLIHCGADPRGDDHASGY